MSWRQNKLDGAILATPALAAGNICVSTESDLYSLGLEIRAMRRNVPARQRNEARPNCLRGPVRHYFPGPLRWTKTLGSSPVPERGRHLRFAESGFLSS